MATTQLLTGDGEPVGQSCQCWDGKISPLGNPSLPEVVGRGWGGEDNATLCSEPGRESWEQRSAHGLVPRDGYRALVARFWAGGGVQGGEGLASRTQ